MLNLKVDGVVKNLPIENETIFGEVMERLVQKIKDEGRVITNIMMNDQSLVGGKQAEFYKFPLHQIETLELITADPYQLANDALESTMEHLQKLKRGCLRTAELFRTGNDIEANDNYSKFIDNLRWFFKAINAMTGMMKIDVNQPLAQGMSLQQYQDELVGQILDQMYEVQKEEDWIAMADIMEYELVEALSQWERILPVLQHTFLEN